MSFKPAYTNNEINSEENHEFCTWFSAVVGWGAPHSKIDDLSIYPPNIILDLLDWLYLILAFKRLARSFATDIQKDIQLFTLNVYHLRAWGGG